MSCLRPAQLFRKHSAGFMRAYLTTRTIIDERLTMISSRPLVIKTQPSELVLKVKFASHRFRPNHSRGSEMATATAMSIAYLFKIIRTISPTLAPTTFRMLISLILFSRERATILNKPTQARTIEKKQKIENKLACLLSASYNFPILSSANVNSNGVPGK